MPFRDHKTKNTAPFPRPLPTSNSLRRFVSQRWTGVDAPVDSTPTTGSRFQLYRR